MPWRFTIGQMMTLTGVIAVNVAFLAATTRVMDLIIAVYVCGPIMVCAQLALYRALFGNRARRPFWLGFAATGAAATVVLYWAYFYTPFPNETLRVYASLWDLVSQIAPSLDRIVSAHDWSINAAFTLYHFVPQILLALAGGAFAARLTRARARSVSHQLPPTGAQPNPGAAPASPRPAL